MPAPRRFDRDDALRQAMELFWEKGYDAVGIRELGEAMGLGASSLYQAFQGKHRLYLEALDRYRDDVIATWLSPLLDPGAGGLAAIDTLFERTVAGQLADRVCRGCLMANAATEVAPRDADVRARTDAHVHRMVRAFRRALERARDLGEVRSDADLDTAARGLAALSQGVLVLSKATGADPAILRGLPAQPRAMLAPLRTGGAGDGA